MGAFEFFPYTNFHELNLDWLLRKVREYIERFEKLDGDFKKLQDNFDDLKTWVESFIDEGLKDAVDAKLDEWLEDGTIEALVNGEVYGALLHYVPDNEEREEYIQDVLETMVDWLEHNHGGDYFASGSPVDQGAPLTVKYSTGRGYVGMYGTYEFITSDVDTVDGVECNVCYMDCTTFVSLVQRNIKWVNSPYYNMMHRNDPVRAYKSGLITFTDLKGKKPFLTDAYGDITTYQEAFLLDVSGNMPLRLSKASRNPANSSELFTDFELNEANLKNLKTGDIVWVGDNTLSAKGVDRENQYKRIHHDTIFVKSLDELNALTSNVQFKISDEVEQWALERGFDMKPEYGYIVHCTGNDTTRANGLKITTLWAMMHSIPSFRENVYEGQPNYPGGRVAERGVYFTDGANSNTGVDSRYDFFANRFLRANNATYMRTGLSLDDDDLYSTSVTGTWIFNQGLFECYSLGSRGLQIPYTDVDHEEKKVIFDLNKMNINGHYTRNKNTYKFGGDEAYTKEYRNFPPDMTPTIGEWELYLSGYRRGEQSRLYIKELPEADKDYSNGVQIIFNIARKKVYCRNADSTLSPAQYSDWQLLAERHKRGVANKASRAANSITEVTVEYSGVFNNNGIGYLPALYVTPHYDDADITAEEAANISVYVKERTLTGATICVVNNNSRAISIGFFWRAEE